MDPCRWLIPLWKELRVRLGDPGGSQGPHGRWYLIFHQGHSQCLCRGWEVLVFSFLSGERSSCRGIHPPAVLAMFFQRDLHNPVGITPVFLTEFKHPRLLFVSSWQGKHSGPGRSHTPLCFGKCQIPSHTSGTICCPLNIGLQCSHGMLQLDLFPDFQKFLLRKGCEYPGKVFPLQALFSLPGLGSCPMDVQLPQAGGASGVWHPFPTRSSSLSRLFGSSQVRASLSAGDSRPTKRSQTAFPGFSLLQPGKNSFPTPRISDEA